LTVLTLRKHKTVKWIWRMPKEIRSLLNKFVELNTFKELTIESIKLMDGCQRDLEELLKTIDQAMAKLRQA
jgi:hypothetical protein